MSVNERPGVTFGMATFGAVSLCFTGPDKNALTELLVKVWAGDEEYEYYRVCNELSITPNGYHRSSESGGYHVFDAKRSAQELVRTASSSTYGGNFIRIVSLLYPQERGFDRFVALFEAALLKVGQRVVVRNRGRKEFGAKGTITLISGGTLTSVNLENPMRDWNDIFPMSDLAPDDAPRTT